MEGSTRLSLQAGTVPPLRYLSRALQTHQLTVGSGLTGAPALQLSGPATPASARSSHTSRQQARPLQGAGALPAPAAAVVLPPPRFCNVRCLALKTEEAAEAAFPVAPLHAAYACWCARARQRG